MGQQTSYSINTGVASYPGQIGDSGYHDIVSALAVAAALPYGVLAVTDSSNTSDMQHRAARLPAASGDITTVGTALGVVVAEQTHAQNSSFSVPTYSQYEAVPLMRQGRVWVYAETAVTDGNACYVRYASGTGTQLGAFRADGDTSTAAILPGAKFVGTTSAAGYVMVELNLV